VPSLPCACFRSGINAKRTHAPKWTPPNTHSALAPKWTVPLLSPLPQHSQLRCFRDFAMRPPSLRARRFLVAVPLLPSFFPSGSWASGCGGAGVLVWRPRSARHQVKRHSAQSCGADPLRSSTSIFIRQHSHAHCLHSLPHSVCRHNEPAHHARLLALALFLPALHRTAMHQPSRHHSRHCEHSRAAGCLCCIAWRSRSRLPRLWGLVVFWGWCSGVLAALPATCDQVNQQRKSRRSTAMIRSIEQSQFAFSTSASPCRRITLRTV